MFNDTIHYNDSALCAAVGVAYKYSREKENKPIHFAKEEKKLICTLFPNPTDRYASIRFNEIPDGLVHIAVYDIKGNVLLTDSKEFNTNFYDIDTKRYPPGVYTIVIQTIKNNFDFKLKVVR